MIWYIPPLFLLSTKSLPALPSLQVVTTDTRLYLDSEEVKNWRFEETKLDDLVRDH